MLRKIANGADEFPNLRAFVKNLVKKIDYNNDGKISFEELCESLHNF